MVKTAGLTFLSRASGAILTFCLVILVSQWLGAEVRGVCGFYLVIITTTTILSDIAGGPTAPYLLRFYAASRLLIGQITWSILPAVLVPLIFLFFSKISLAEFILLVLAGWLNGTWSIQQQLLLGLKKFGALNIISMVIPALAISLFSVFYLSGFRSSLTYLSAVGLSFFLAVIAGFFLLKHALKFDCKPEPPPGNMKIFRMGLQNQLAHIASLLNSRLIYFLLPAASLGLWSNILTLGEAFFLIPGSLGQVAYGMLAGTNRKEGKNDVFAIAWWVNLVILIPGLIIAALMPDWIWQWVFGAEFTGMAGLLKSIIPGMGVYSLYLLISYRQSASGNFKLNFYALMAGLLVNLLVTGIMHAAKIYTLNGGILALCLGWGTASVVAIILIRKTNPGAFGSFFRLPF